MSEPLSAAHRRLGGALKQLRVRRGKSLEGLRVMERTPEKQFSKGYLSNVERGVAPRPSLDVLAFYVRYLGGNYEELRFLRDALPRVHARKHEKYSPDENADLLLAKYPRGYRTLSRIKRQVVEDKKWTEMHVVSRLELLTKPEQIDLAPVRMRYRADPRPEIFSIVATTGCRLAGTSESADGQLHASFELLPHHIETGRFHIWSYSIYVDSTTIQVPAVYYVHYADAGEQMLEVEFRGAGVREAWWYRDMPQIRATEEPILGQLLASVDGIVGHLFSDVKAQEPYGFAWRWEEE